ncbi:hypothetical protein BDZ94DRAFT_1246660 [Collybia nuda]|uniref:Uncharacterized protein n=1 Tax=Collybia nuda TaxID=64659 RepID=A0A9P6CNL3_9AGAR|nr:hypothetical protein BDZ94DRAFT_1246660 [Collybia nuda]
MRHASLSFWRLRGPAGGRKGIVGNGLMIMISICRNVGCAGRGAASRRVISSMMDGGAFGG